jgi:hypothetical protein
MRIYQIRELEPEAYHFPPDTPDVAELRRKLKGIAKKHRNRPDPILWFGDLCTVIVLSPVLIPVIIIAGIVYLIRRRYDSGTDA